MVRVSDEVYELVAARAERERRSVQAQLHVLLETALRRDGEGTLGEPGGARKPPERLSGAAAAASAGTPSGDGSDSGPRSLHVPGSSSAPKRPKTGMCEHRVPAGTYCKLCGQ